jgi:hypothetical protein
MTKGWAMEFLNKGKVYGISPDMKTGSSGWISPGCTGAASRGVGVLVGGTAVSAAGEKTPQPKRARIMTRVRGSNLLGDMRAASRIPFLEELE